MLDIVIFKNMKKKNSQFFLKSLHRQSINLCTFTWDSCSWWHLCTLFTWDSSWWHLCTFNWDSCSWWDLCTFTWNSSWWDLCTFTWDSCSWWHLCTFTWDSCSWWDLCTFTWDSCSWWHPLYIYLIVLDGISVHLPEIVVLDGISVLEGEVPLLGKVPKKLHKLLLYRNISSPIHVLRFRKIVGEKYSSIIETFHFIWNLKLHQIYF